MDRDIEETVVHELLHIVVRGGSERATNTLAHVLVTERRTAERLWQES